MKKSLTIRLWGDMTISGMGIVTSIQALILMPLFGINQGLQPIIRYNFGAKRLDRVQEALKLSIIGASLISILGFIIVEVFPQQIVRLFNSNDAQLIDFTVNAMRVFLMMLPVLGFQVVGSNYFMAVGRPRPAALLSLSRQFIIFIPAVLILPLFLNLHGVILAGPLADSISSILTGSWLYKELRHLDEKYASHGAIVAREYGIPAVINVPNVMRKITDGTQVIVDGDAGKVYISQEI